jgi:plastocyanin
MKPSIALLIACFSLCLVAAGCGGDDSSGGGGNADTKQQAAPTSEGGGAEVSMEGIKFNPSDVTVKVGDTVTWTNNESVGHDVTADDFKSGDPAAMQSGDTFQHKFDKAGTFDYVCSVHPGMKGSVEVK